LNLDGAQILSNTEKSINGGGRIAMICALNRQYVKKRIMIVSDDKKNTM
jgi:hypothetical protein